MNKKVLLLFVTAMLSIMGAKADVIPSSYYSEPAEGTFYLYNVTQDKFLCGTGDPSLVSTPTNQITLTALTDDDAGKYSVRFVGGKYLKMGYHGGRYLWGNDWSNNGFFKWTFSVDGTKTYNLSITATADADNRFINGHTYYTNGESGMTETVGEANEWALITEENYSSFLSSVAGKKHTILAANGDATSLVTNPSFEDSDVSAWTGGTRKTGINTWRGNGLCDYENTNGGNATFSQIISNMPAGTYKVVAVVRGAKGTTATASINGTSGATITNTEFTDNIQINYNGVQMPKPTFTSAGFNTTTYALGWKWATATYTLADDGDLTISFTMNGSGFRGIDDVHLYYMSDGSNNYAMEYFDGINNNDHVVTCDLITDNPNKVWISASDITTAASAVLKNNFPTTSGWQGFYWVNSLVLYDGYEFTPPTDKTFKAVNSTLYRNITAESFATICCPFQITGGADGTFYQPESLSEGTLNFETVDTKVQGKAYLYKASSAVTAFTGPKDAWLATSPVDNGEGVVMKGRYLNMEEVPYDDYVLSGNNLYKVNSTVTLKPFRAYFTIPSGVTPARISLNFDEDATGIDFLETESANDNKDMKDGKYLENGKIVIVKNGVKYSANGQIVK